MAWSFVAQGALASGNNATSLAPALPAGMRVGDLMVLQFQNFGGTNSRTPSTPSGWTAGSGSGTWLNGTTSHGLWWKIARPGEAAPTLSLSGTGVTGDTQLARIAAFRCSINFLPTFGAAGTQSTNASNDSVGAITGLTPSAGYLVVMSGGKSNDWNGASTAQTGWTKATDSESTTGNDAGMFLHYILSSDGSATGDLTVPDGGATASAGVGLGQILTFNEVVQVYPVPFYPRPKLRAQAGGMRVR